MQLPLHLFTRYESSTEPAAPLGPGGHQESLEIRHTGRRLGRGSSPPRTLPPSRFPDLEKLKFRLDELCTYTLMLPSELELALQGVLYALDPAHLGASHSVADAQEEGQQLLDPR